MFVGTAMFPIVSPGYFYILIINAVMRPLLILLLLGFGIMVNAQPNTHRHWHEGPLTPKDFEAGDRKYKSGWMAYKVRYHPGVERHQDTTVKKLITDAFMVPELSSLPGERTAQALLFNQVLLDLLEIRRRKLQQELDQMGNDWTTDLIFSRHADSLDLTVARLQAETDSGRNKEAIDRWKQYVEENMPVLPAPAHLMWSRVARFGYGLHASLGKSSFTGNLAKAFDPTINVGFGFDFAWNQTILMIHATLGFGSAARQDLYLDNYWRKDTAARLAVIDVSIGQFILDTRRWKLTPFAGLGITEFSTPAREEDEETNATARYSYAAGLQLEYKLHKKINLIPTRGWKVNEYSELMARIRLYTTHFSYSGINGNTVNIAVGISGFGRVVRKK
ncbi:MAG: hypothetical protein EOP49_02300 [Sphingobacteriales bacterium]|nr:MAG: hypothetical protein EOP49_02300 [Sphingobacteriales bacterium]